VTDTPEQAAYRDRIKLILTEIICGLSPEEADETDALLHRCAARMPGVTLGELAGAMAALNDPAENLRLNKILVKRQAAARKKLN
jgi:hypothetical protein